MRCSSRPDLLAVALLVFAVAACGSEDSPAADPSAPDTFDTVEGDTETPDVTEDAVDDADDTTDAEQDAPADTTVDEDAARDTVEEEEVADEDTTDAEDATGDDVATDVDRDVATDAASDVAPDTASDVAPDTAPDVAPDTAPDAAPDVAPDVAPDTAPDAAPDVAPDSGDDCAGELLPVAEIRGTEGLEILADGTVFFSQSEAIGIWTADGGVDARWASLPRLTTVWGLAYRPSDNTLLVATPSGGGQIVAIEVGPTPRPTVIASGLGAPNGLAMGPDGSAYFSDFGGGALYRIDPANRVAAVTGTDFRQPNGIYVDDDGTLLVVSYATGEIFRVTLTDGFASEITRVGAIDGAPDGITRDADGNHYVSDNAGGTIYRFDARFADETVIARDIGAAANLVFGRGPLRCSTLYVASSGRLGAVETESRFRDRRP